MAPSGWPLTVNVDPCRTHAIAGRRDDAFDEQGTRGQVAALANEIAHGVRHAKGDERSRFRGRGQRAARQPVEAERQTGRRVPDQVRSEPARDREANAVTAADEQKPAREIERAHGRERSHE